MTNQEILSQVQATVRNKLPHYKCYLFGSRSRNDYRPDSDIDLLILLPDTYTSEEFSHKEYEVCEIFTELMLKNNMEFEISPLILQEKVFYARKTPFTINVMNEGILL